MKTLKTVHIKISFFVKRVAAKSLQSCPTWCDPIDGSPRGSPIPGILQARTLEWVAISFSNAWKWKVKVKSLSRVWLLATPWTAAHQAPPSMGFSRQEYCSGVPLPSLIKRVRFLYKTQEMKIDPSGRKYKKRDFSLVTRGWEVREMGRGWPKRTNFWSVFSLTCKIKEGIFWTMFWY